VAQFRDAAEAPQAGTAQKSEKNRLEVVVSMMRGQHQAGVMLLGHTSQASVASIAHAEFVSIFWQF
jgi:hypothetical protein